jgi:site-specific DNA-adenine methylase
MKNHFFYPYFGNKREEVEHLYNLLDLKNIDTIVEPFCGSCSVSYFTWTQNKDEDLRYILNDLDGNLINLLQSIRSGEYKKIEDEVNKIREEVLKSEIDIQEAKTINLKRVKRGKISGYILGHKNYTIRPGLFPLTDFTKFNTKFNN